MLRLSALMMLAAFGLWGQRVDSSREIRKQQAWNQGQRVEIDHRMGDLIVRGTSSREVQVFALVRTSAASKADADKLAAQIDVVVETTPSAIIIRTKYPEQQSSSWLGFNWNKTSYSTRLEISMPSAAAMRSQNSFGKTELTGLRGGVDATNKNGSLRDTEGSGAHRISNSFGSVDVLNIQGQVNVSGANGSATVTNVDELNLTNRFGKSAVQTVKGNLSVEANNGAVEAFDVGGTAVVGGSFGSVTVARIKGGLTLKNQNGSVDVRTVGGSATISNSFGSLTFSDVSGGVIANGQNGKIIGSKAAGPVEVKNSFGGVEITGVQKGVRVTAGNAGVTLQDVAGEIYVQTSFGTATITKATGPVTVMNQNGAVHVTGATSGVKAKTSFGAIEIQGAGGPVDVSNQNGSITIAGLGAKCQAVTATASFGTVNVALPQGVGYDASAATTFGKVKSDFEMTIQPGTQGEGRIEGKIAGGGCPLRIVNANGSINITKAP